MVWEAKSHSVTFTTLLLSSGSSSEQNDEADGEAGFGLWLGSLSSGMLSSREFPVLGKHEL